MAAPLSPMIAPRNMISTRSHNATSSSSSVVTSICPCRSGDLIDDVANSAFEPTSMPMVGSHHEDFRLGSSHLANRTSLLPSESWRSFCPRLGRAPATDLCCAGGASISLPSSAPAKPVKRDRIGRQMFSVSELGRIRATGHW